MLTGDHRASQGSLNLRLFSRFFSWLSLVVVGGNSKPDTRCSHLSCPGFPGCLRLAGCAGKRVMPSGSFCTSSRWFCLPFRLPVSAEKLCRFASTHWLSSSVPDLICI